MWNIINVCWMFSNMASVPLTHFLPRPWQERRHPGAAMHTHSMHVYHVDFVRVKYMLNACAFRCQLKVDYMYATNDTCDVHCSTHVTSYCGNMLSWFHQPHIMLLDFDVHCSMKFLVFGSRGSWVCEHLTELWGDRESWCSVKQTLPVKF